MMSPVRVLVVLGLTLLQVSMSPCLAMNWCPRYCACFNDYRTADCSHQNLAEVPALCNQTTHLYLEKNAIQFLPNGTFRSLPNLLLLHLQENELTVLRVEAFCGLRKVRTLNLSGNKIASLEYQEGCKGGENRSNSIAPECCSMSELRELVLSGNKLTEIPKNLALFVPSLEILNMSLNDISSAALDSSFAELTSLRMLDLSRNHIHEVFATDFAALQYVPLQMLSLAHCAMFEIHNGSLQGMTNLTSFSLAGNLLETQSLVNIFRGIGDTSALVHLDIRDMEMSNLSLSLLQSFHQLVILEASNSAIRHVDPQIFDMLPHLETLHLEQNQLTVINNLASARKLRRLHLSGNQLSAVNLTGLDNIQAIDISSNKIVSLPEGWLREPKPSLQHVNASNNGITSVDPLAFDRISVHTLDLSRNNLLLLHNYGLESVQDLKMSHNRLSGISPDAFDYLGSEIQELDIRYNNLSHFQGNTFPEFRALQKLLLGHNRLGPALRTNADPDAMGELFSQLGHLQVLDLSENSITELHTRHLDPMHHLSTLDLSGNQIRNLADLPVSGLISLAKLTVADNELSNIDADVLLSVKYLEEVDLSHNPFDCTCGLMPFLSWANTTFALILNKNLPDSYQCMYPPSMEGISIFMFRPDPKELARCPAEKQQQQAYRFNVTTVIWIAVACLIITLVLVGTLLCYGQICHQIKSLHYRWQIRYREVSGVEFTTSAEPKV